MTNTEWLDRARAVRGLLETIDWAQLTGEEVTRLDDIHDLVSRAIIARSSEQMRNARMALAALGDAVRFDGIGHKQHQECVVVPSRILVRNNVLVHQLTILTSNIQDSDRCNASDDTHQTRAMAGDTDAE